STKSSGVFLLNTPLKPLNFNIVRHQNVAFIHPVLHNRDKKIGILNCTLKESS
ncbi:MAG: hypothetical protein ACI80W_001881, partial [Porticoccaceae bacterium]